MHTPRDSRKRVGLPIVILICALLTPELGAASFSLIPSPDTPTYGDPSSPGDGGWLRRVPSIIRRLLIKVQEELGVPRP